MRIGIITAAFNAASWIGDAIRSVLAQTHRDWVMLVVDDGSTDATAELVAGFTDPRIRLIRQPNAGVSAARNRGIADLVGTDPSPQPWSASRPKPARGGGELENLLVDAVLFLDADDWLAPDALSRLACALDASPGAVAAVGGYASGESCRSRRPASGDVLERLLVRNLFANGGHLLLRGNAVQAAGGFRPDLVYGEDWEYWIRVALQGPFIAVRGTDPVLFVRQDTGGAYQRLACDPCAFVPCMDAIFGNPALLACVGPRTLSAIRRRTEAENHWIVGRELIRHGRQGEGWGWLQRSVRATPTLRRVALLAAAVLFPLLPHALCGPFRPYCPPQPTLRVPSRVPHRVMDC